MNVLITAIGSNTAISIVKALRKSSQHHFIVGIDSNVPHLCAGYSFTDQFYNVPGARTKQDYLRSLKEIIKVHKIECLIPVHDLEIETVAEFYDELAQYTFVAVNNLSIVRCCNNKAEANRVAREAGLAVPREHKSDNHSDNFPLIAKPLTGVSSSGITVIKDLSSLKSFLLLHDKNDFIMQDFVEGIEYTVDTYSHYTGEFYGGVVRRRIETKAGISTKGVTLKNDELIDQCRLLLNHLGYRGAANLQFIERNGSYFFIEINPRFSGAGILSYESGFNSPYFTLREASSEKLPPFNTLNIHYNLYMTRYWQESFFQL